MFLAWEKSCPLEIYLSEDRYELLSFRLNNWSLRFEKKLNYLISHSPKLNNTADGDLKCCWINYDILLNSLLSFLCPFFISKASVMRKVYHPSREERWVRDLSAWMALDLHLSLLTTQMQVWSYVTCILKSKTEKAQASLLSLFWPSVLQPVMANRSDSHTQSWNK